jgi:hypothetical protein
MRKQTHIAEEVTNSADSTEARKCCASLVQRFRYILDVYIRYTVLEVSNKADRKAIDRTDFLADGVDIEERLHHTSQKKKMQVTAPPNPRTRLGCFRNTTLEWI